MSTNKLPASPEKARKNAGLTMTELADRVPCALSTIYFCETAKRYPKHRALRASYLRALGLKSA